MDSTNGFNLRPNANFGVIGKLKAKVVKGIGQVVAVSVDEQVNRPLHLFQQLPSLFLLFRECGSGVSEKHRKHHIDDFLQEVKVGELKLPELLSRIPKQYTTLYVPAQQPTEDVQRH
ncbi:hypothetical protein TYRP_003430 [Tyrophagus putrescentiae]|nr:hypothetical protein TYRP_003430 [Tyrophagus putrescentiae]